MTDTAVLTSRPDHVPESAVYDFDIHHDAALLADPHERVREIVKEAPPLFWTPRNRGHWMALKYEYAFKVMREPDIFSSAPFSPEQKAAIVASMPPGAPRMIELIPILMDPPEHTKYRAPLQKVFSPKKMMSMKGEIEALANQLMDDIVDRGHCDFFTEVTEQLPVRVFLKMMGLPEERLDEFRALVREVFQPSHDPAEMGRRIRAIATAMMGIILERRENPQDDLISLLWATEVVEGEPMTIELMEDYAALLFLAGLDTVINGMGFGIRHLAMNPDFQEELRANPDRIVDATEELLRRYTFTVSQRRVTKDTELGGQPLKTGENVVVYMPAADLDPTEFENPALFDPARENKVHMAFGVGPHRCLGSHLARIELQTLYEVVLKRLPPFRLDPEKPVVFHAGMMLAMSALPLRWD